MERLFLPVNTEVQQRVETPDEIAGLVSFVCSPVASAARCDDRGRFDQIDHPTVSSPDPAPGKNVQQKQEKSKVEEANTKPRRLINEKA